MAAGGTRTRCSCKGCGWVLGSGVDGVRCVRLFGGYHWPPAPASWPAGSPTRTHPSLCSSTTETPRRHRRGNKGTRPHAARWCLAAPSTPPTHSSPSSPTTGLPPSPNPPPQSPDFSSPPNPHVFTGPLPPRRHHAQGSSGQGEQQQGPRRGRGQPSSGEYLRQM